MRGESGLFFLISSLSKGSQVQSYSVVSVGFGVCRWTFFLFLENTKTDQAMRVRISRQIFPPKLSNLSPRVRAKEFLQLS